MGRLCWTNVLKKNSWFDHLTMKNITEEFVEKKNETFGGKWVILFCGNIYLHWLDEVLGIFSRNKVFVVLLVPSFTDVIQDIDTRIGQLIHIYVDQELDIWLSDNGNLGKRESGFKSKEWQVLMKKCVAVDKNISYVEWFESWCFWKDQFPPETYSIMRIW